MNDLLTAPGGVEVLFTPGGVHELRIPKAGRYRVVSGYYNDAARLAADAARLDGQGYPGIYFTLNPTVPALLARCENAVKSYAETTTSDHDIAARRWLIVDLDPVRPAGIPSTDVEHDAAFTRAATITTHLTGLGWPSPVVMDSGNGVYLLYRIDLPNDDQATDLVKRCLIALAVAFDDAVVVVDRSVFNAARVVRIPGTTNRKGTGAGDRPHRVARILAAPPGTSTVPVELLTGLADPGPVEQPRRGEPARAAPNGVLAADPGGFDLEGFIARHIKVKGPKHNGGREIWSIDVCPFNPDHAQGEAYIGRQPTGALFAGCHHNSCDWGWKELRALFEPVPEQPPGEKMGPAARNARKSRPPLHVGSPANAAEWLRVTVGTGPLAGMFNRGGVVVHCPCEGQDGYMPPSDERDNDGPAQVRAMTGGALAARIQYTYDCYQEKETDAGRERVAAMFPGSAAKVPLEVPDMLPNLRTLRGVTHTPLVRADGTILNRPGYDPGTGYLYLPDPGLTVPEVPDQPSHHQVAAAVALLDKMTAGFRYVTSHDRANYYGALLTPLLRELVPPPYKMIVFTAPQPGSGKSLQAEVVRILHGGVFRSECPEDDAEMRKVVTTILDVTTGPVVTLDNVTGVLRSSTLAGLLTSGRWEDRALGSNALISRPNDRLWTLTGNNVSLGGDLVRRSVWVTIDPRVPHPELRTDFAITDLPGWARARRGELLAALLTLVRAWAVAGQPVHLERGDSFARWIGVVRGILSVAGVPGTFDHADSARQQVGTDDDDWSDFLRAAHQVFGETTWTVKELLGKVAVSGARTFEGVLPDPFPETGIPLDALPGPIADHVAKGGQLTSQARKLGTWLRNRDGRWAGPLVARASGEDPHKKVKLWRIESIEDKTPLTVAGSAGSAGFDHHHLQEKAVEDSGIPDGAPPGFSGHLPETHPAHPAHPASGRAVAGEARPLCQGCGEPMILIEPGQTTHFPGCGSDAT